MYPPDAATSQMDATTALPDSRSLCTCRDGMQYLPKGHAFVAAPRKTTVVASGSLDLRYNTRARRVAAPSTFDDKPKDYMVSGNVRWWV